MSRKLSRQRQRLELFFLHWRRKTNPRFLVSWKEMALEMVNMQCGNTIIHYMEHFLNSALKNTHVWNASSSLYISRLVSHADWHQIEVIMNMLLQHKKNPQQLLFFVSCRVCLFRSRRGSPRSSLETPAGCPGVVSITPTVSLVTCVSMETTLSSAVAGDGWPQELTFDLRVTQGVVGSAVAGGLDSTHTDWPSF